MAVLRSNKPVDEAKAVTAGYGERAPVTREIPTESARNGEIPKLQTRLSGTMPPSALSGIVVQTFPNGLGFFYFDIPGRTDEQLSSLNSAMNDLSAKHHLDGIEIYSSTH